MELVLGPPPEKPAEHEALKEMPDPAQYYDARVRVVVLDSAREFGLPKQATPGSAGFDLVSVETVVLQPFRPVVVKTGLKVAVPKGFELQVRPRSGMSLNENVIVANSPGTVDSDYRGEVGVILTFIPPTPANPAVWPVKKIERGTRIAQAVIARVPSVLLEQVSELDDTQRGQGGFGSTGARA